MVKVYGPRRVTFFTKTRISDRIRNSCPMQLTCNLHFYIAHLQHYFNVVTLERHIPDHERYLSQTTMNKS
ncbi:hypothetical protein T02_813 [Trichinella nativa]|uniref:Uncharacterized protein n=1 Tax=Trichinella nativa TaxID=6335 RepID=A0A0V1L4P4_9BILA|nr:hypothetical protein T02_813 [Trichinella nativa]